MSCFVRRIFCIHCLFHPPSCSLTAPPPYDCHLAYPFLSTLLWSCCARSLNLRSCIKYTILPSSDETGITNLMWVLRRCFCPFCGIEAMRSGEKQGILVILQLLLFRQQMSDSKRGNHIVARWCTAFPSAPTTRQLGSDLLLLTLKLRIHNVYYEPVVLILWTVVYTWKYSESKIEKRVS